MMIHYNYRIGDTVRIIKELHQYKSHLCDFNEFKNIVGKEYKINGYGWDIDENNKLTQFYQLYAHQDKYLYYHNQITEEYLEAVGYVHSFDENISNMMKSHDNQELKIHQKIYSSIYYGSREKSYIDEKFTFACYGSIVRFHRFRSEYDNNIDAFIKREFLCENKDGKEYRDARKFGKVSTYHPGGILVNINKDFAQEYLDTCFRKRNSSILKETSYDFYDVHSWLTHMGIWEQVMDLYKKRKCIKK